MRWLGGYPKVNCDCLVSLLVHVEPGVFGLGGFFFLEASSIGD
jgi:hypothetical protein